MRYKKIAYFLFTTLCAIEVSSSEVFDFMNTFNDSSTRKDIQNRFISAKAEVSEGRVSVQDVIVKNFPETNSLNFSFINDTLSEISLISRPPSLCLDQKEQIKRICRRYHDNILDSKQNLLKKFRKKLGVYKIVKSDYPRDEIFLWESSGTSYFLIYESTEEGVANLKILIKFSKRE